MLTQCHAALQLLALSALARCLRPANALPVPRSRAACTRPAPPAHCPCTTCSARPLPRAPLLPASSPCPARPCWPRAALAPARPAAQRASANCSPSRQHALQPTAPARPAVQPLPSRAAQAKPCRPTRAALPIPSRASLPHFPAPPSRPAAATAAAGSAGSAGGAAGSARGANGSAGGARGAGGSAGGAATDCHCLSWPLSRPGGGGFGFMGHSDASWANDQATQRSSHGYIFSLGSGSVSWRSTCSSSVLGSSCEAESYAGAMSAQDLHWLTFLLTDSGKRLRSPPVLYVDNKAMLALCHEQRLEHRTKHIDLRYFLAR
ncbi:unnamed protein product [Closterium sp. NIES-54]